MYLRFTPRKQIVLEWSPYHYWHKKTCLINLWIASLFHSMSFLPPSSLSIRRFCMGSYRFCIEIFCIKVVKLLVFCYQKIKWKRPWGDEWGGNVLWPNLTDVRWVMMTMIKEMLQCVKISKFKIRKNNTLTQSLDISVQKLFVLKFKRFDARNSIQVLLV